MTIFGQVLIYAGFLLGAYASSTDPRIVPLPMYLIGLAISVVGIVLTRVGHRQHAHSEHTLTTNLEAIGSSLEALVVQVDRLEKEKEDLFVYDVHGKIDELFPEHLDRFVQARQSLIHAFSMNDYANLMNHFAAGERGINRVWSASVDGYADEVKQWITKAATHFRDADAFFKRLQNPAA